MTNNINKAIALKLGQLLYKIFTRANKKLTWEVKSSYIMGTTIPIPGITILSFRWETIENNLSIAYGIEVDVQYYEDRDFIKLEDVMRKAAHDQLRNIII